MVTTLIVFICILTVLLILIVLVQNSKGGGLTGEFGGLGSNQLMGVKKTTDLLEQITWGLGAGVMILTLACYLLVDRTGGTQVNSVNVEKAQSKTLPGGGLTAPAPGAGGTPPTTPSAAAPDAAPAGQPAPVNNPTQAPGAGTPAPQK